MLFNREYLASSSSELEKPSLGAGRDKSTVLRILSTADDELVAFSALRSSKAARTLRSRASSMRILSVGVCLGFLPDSYEQTVIVRGENPGSESKTTPAVDGRTWLTILGQSAILAWAQSCTFDFSQSAFITSPG